VRVVGSQRPIQLTLFDESDTHETVKNEIKHGGADSQATKKPVRSTLILAGVLEDLLHAICELSNGGPVDHEALYNQCRTELDIVRSRNGR